MADYNYAIGAAAAAQAAAVDTAKAQRALAAANGAADARHVYDIALAGIAYRDAVAAAEQHQQDALAAADETYAHAAAQVDHDHYLTDRDDWDKHIGFPSGWYMWVVDGSPMNSCNQGMGWGCMGANWGWSNGGFAFAPLNMGPSDYMGMTNPFIYGSGSGDYAWLWNGWLCDTTSTGVTESCGYLGSYGRGGSSVSDLGQAQDTLQNDRQQAEKAYAREMGDAKIAYATDVGNADIGLATEKGLAAIQYESGLAQAANDGDTTALEQASRATVNPARVQYAGYRESANQQHRTDEKNANINRVDIEGYDAVDATAWRALAEATYQLAVANQHKAIYQAIATSTDATGQQVFDYQRSVAEANWINGLTSAYVLHAWNVAFAEEYWRPYTEAKNPPAVEIDPSASAQWVSAEIGRGETQALYSESYAGTELAQELARNGAHAEDSATLNRVIAKAAQKNAVDIAKADKKFAVTQAENSGASSGSALDQADRTHKVEVAQAALAYTTGVEDAKLKFQHNETNSRKGYSQILAGAQKTRDTTLAGAAKSTAIAEAGYQASADFSFAQGEEINWRDETMYDNIVANQKAMADIGLWTAQESANVTAVQALDTVYGLPWTGFLVAEAQAHKDWWTTSGAPRYTQWISDENAAQMSYTQALIGAHHGKLEGSPQASVTGINDAKKQYATALATAAGARDNQEAQDRYSEVTSMIVPTKTYLDDVAQAEHDKPVSLAQAEVDRASGVDGETVDAEIDQAKETYESTLDQKEQGYAQAAGQAMSIWYMNVATDEHGAADAWINADVTRVHADAAAQDWYDHDADAKLVTITDTRDSLSKTYTEDEAASWIAALTTLDSTSSTQWSAFALTQETHYRDDYLLAADAAQQTLDHETALAEQVMLDVDADTLAQGQNNVEGEWASEEHDRADESLAGATAAAIAAGAEAASDLPQEVATPATAAITTVSVSIDLCLGNWDGYCFDGYGYHPYRFGSNFYDFTDEPYAIGYEYGFDMNGWPVGGTSAEEANADRIAHTVPIITAQPAAAAELVAPPESVSPSGLLPSAAAAAARAAMAVISYQNPIGSLLLSAATTAAPLGAVVVEGVVSSGGETEAPPKPWTKEDLQLVMNAISQADVNLTHFARFWNTYVTLKDTLKASPVVHGWFWWSKDTYPFSVDVKRDREIGKLIGSGTIQMGNLDRILVDAPPNESAFQIAQRVMDQIGKDTDLSNAYLDYLIGLKWDLQLRPGGTDAIENLTRAQKLDIVRKAGHDAEMYLKLTVSLLGPGGILMVAWTDLSQGHFVSAALGFLSLLPLGKLAEYGLSKIQFVAKNGEVVEVTAGGLKLFSRSDPAQQADTVRRLGQLLDAAEDGAQVSAALRAEGGAGILRFIDDVLDAMCFTRDTLVATATGLKPIGVVQAGELVQAFDFERGVWLLGEVIKRHDNVYSGPIVSVYLGQSVVEATINHPFWVMEGEDLTERAVPPEFVGVEDHNRALHGRWVTSQNLRAGDLISCRDGKPRRVEKIEQRLEEGLPVSNLTVRDHHTFAVGSCGALVHNTGWCDILYLKAGKPRPLLNMVANDPSLRIHAHHIVLKTIPEGLAWASRRPWILRGQQVLERNKIPLLATTSEAARVATKDPKELYNLTWALNQGHSEQYCRSVAQALEAAEKEVKGISAKAIALRRQRVIARLEEIAGVLAEGGEYVYRPK